MTNKKTPEAFYTSGVFYLLLCFFNAFTNTSAEPILVARGTQCTSQILSSAV
ncbi:MAG: hypothetical protein K0R54_4936, partial [Clostridiaceae bacterium]|nr:hypothetical protein [Clostridiaceae bacterium]